MAAIATSHAIITALFSRTVTGQGQELHVSLFSSAIWLMYANLMITSAMGREIDTSWDRRRFGVLRSTFLCQDGEWLAGVHNPEDRYWPRFCQALGRPDLAADPALATRELRAERLPELYDQLDPEFLKRTRDEWLKIFTEGGLMFSRVQRFQEVLQDPQAAANGYIVDVDHPHLGQVRLPGYPISFGKDAVSPYQPAPSLGQHTDEVLASLGFGPDEIASFRERNVVG
jgi:formyl-CoA transferase